MIQRQSAEVVEGSELSRSPFPYRDGWNFQTADERSLIPPTKTQAAVSDETLAHDDEGKILRRLLCLPLVMALEVNVT